MEIWNNIIGSALIFGLMGGLTPGPLLTYILSETLKKGKKTGIKLSFVPLLTDLPIVFISFVLSRQLQRYPSITGAIYLIGALFIIYLAYDNIFYKGRNRINKQKNNPISKGMLVNFFNPHPYLFWISIGSPLLIKYQAIDWRLSCLFLFIFYLMLVGSKITLVILTARGRRFIEEETYVWIIRLLGITLLFFALIFIKDGLGYLDI